MGLFHCHIFSEELDRNTSFYVALPESGRRVTKDGIIEKYRVLYLLPGKEENHTKWLRMISIEWIAQDCQLAVVLPDAGSEEDRGDFFRYIGQELPQIARMYFPLSEKKEDHIINDPELIWIKTSILGGDTDGTDTL